MTRRSRRSRWAKARPAFGYDMTAAEAADFLGISSRRLAGLRRDGRGPYHVRWRRRVWYSLNDLIFFHKVHTDALSVTPRKTESDG